MVFTRMPLRHCLPWCTQFNYFLVNGESSWQPTGAFYLVDLPGVGYAKVPKKQRDLWRAFMDDYLSTRSKLKVVFHLVDSRHGPVAQDKEVMAMVAAALDARAKAAASQAPHVPPPLAYVVVLTKADKKETVRMHASAAAVDGNGGDVRKRTGGLRATMEAVAACLETSGCARAYVQAHGSSEGARPEVPVLLTSSVTRMGRDHMWRFLRLAADAETFEK